MEEGWPQIATGLHFYITLRVIEHGAHQSGLCMFDHLSLKLQLKDEITVASCLTS